MTLKQVGIGEECRRPHWRKSLTVIKESMSKWCYYENGKPAGTISLSSTMMLVDDFEIKEQKMKAQDIKILVVTTRAQNNGQSIKSFSTEEDALDYIADYIDCEPKARFTMFKPYQKVENKRIDLKKLITKL